MGIDSAIFMHPTIWKASGHVDAFNDPLIDNRDSKKRYRADVLIEDQIAKYDEKIEKEVAKARKRFKEAFNEEQYLATSPRVLEIKQKRDALHERYAAAMQGPDLEELKQIILDEEIVDPISGTKNWTEELDRRAPVQPDVLHRDGFYRRWRHEDLPAPRDGTRHLRELPERAEDRPHEAALRHRSDR